MAKPAKPGDRVRVHYIGKTDDDEVFDSTMGKQPVEMRLGDGWNMPGFEEAIIGMEAGQTKTISIPPEKAFGLRDPKKVFKVAKTSIPDSQNPTPGQHLRANGPDGQPIDMIIVRDEGDAWLMDSNHPLGGKTLVFEIGLAEII
ncbi:MAG: FKBP-type peptidyl-prolyl cis-trans isomerase [Magnetovibrionaceae bacterium]